MIQKILDFFKKLLGRKEAGFTLVELLIVIALIGILAGAVVATLNPIEQINKANDAKAANDAAEVVNALERYYASQNKYPWNVIDDTTVDSAYGIVSNKVGFGVCGAATIVDSFTDCDGNTEGSLIATDELKGSFTTKSYFDTTATDLEKMYLYKFASDGTYPNAIYVCYVPRAKVNRTSANRLWILTTDATDTWKPTNLEKAPTDPTDTDYGTYFKADGNPKSTYADLANSLLKCMPE